MSETTFRTIAIVLYFIGMLAIGWFAYRRTKNNLDDYMLAGRGLRPSVAALSAGASDMSGWLLMGLPGALYMSGMVEAWIAIGLTVGAGAFYSDKQYGDVANTKWIPSYTRFDAMASYAIQDNISLQLNVQNLTDKTYFTKAYASHYASIAPGRSATLALNVKF